MSDQTDEVEAEEPDAVEQAIAFYAELGPINDEYKKARVERAAILSENRYLTAEQAARWQQAKQARSEFRSAMRSLAQANGTANPFAAKAETASVSAEAEGAN